MTASAFTSSEFNRLGAERWTSEPAIGNTEPRGGKSTASDGEPDLSRLPTPSSEEAITVWVVAVAPQQLQVDSPQRSSERTESGPTIGPYHRIADETFFIDKSGDEIILGHDRWSLVGRGATLLDAEQDLIAEAADLAPVLLRQSAVELSDDLVKLRDFVLRVI